MTQSYVPLLAPCEGEQVEAEADWQADCDTAGSVAFAERELRERFAGSRIDHERQQVVIFMAVREEDAAERARRVDADRGAIVGGRGCGVRDSVRVEPVKYSYGELSGYKREAIEAAGRLGSGALTGAGLDQVQNRVTLYIDPVMRDDAVGITADLPPDCYSLVEGVLRLEF